MELFADLLLCAWWFTPAVIIAISIAILFFICMCPIFQIEHAARNRRILQENREDKEKLTEILRECASIRKKDDAFRFMDCLRFADVWTCEQYTTVLCTCAQYTAAFFLYENAISGAMAIFENKFGDFSGDYAAHGEKLEQNEERWAVLEKRRAVLEECVPGWKPNAKPVRRRRTRTSRRNMAEM